MTDDRPKQKVDDEVLRNMVSGDNEAFRIVVDEYFPRLVRAAEKRISASRQRASDGEDVAVSVFESLWKRADQGMFTEDAIPDADALWRFLQRVMQSKVTDHMRRELAAKRGAGKNRGESVFVNSSGEEVGGLGDFQPQMSPAELAELAECEQEMLEQLPDETLREIAVLRMEGYEVLEIAEKLSLSDRSIKRKLAIIRECWESQLPN